MGKWSPDGIDYVLAGKMKTVVDSVNARIRLDTEPGQPPIQPTITYEQFVEDLDLGDSFTSVLFEALVKEMAERRKRKSTSDKRMISRRTQKLLQNLHHASRVMDDGLGLPGRPRRGLYASLSASGYEAMHDVFPEDDDLATRPSVMGVGGAVLDDYEDSWDDQLFDFTMPSGTRELHDTYYPGVRGPFRSGSLRWPPSRLPAESADTWTFIPRPPSAPTPQTAAVTSTDRPPAASTTPAGSAAPSGSSLTRQPTIRRTTTRNRLDQFSDYTSLRRVNARFDAEASTSNERGESGASAPAPGIPFSLSQQQRAWEAATPPWGAGGSTSGHALPARLVNGTTRFRRMQQLQAQATASAAAAAAAAFSGSSGSVSMPNLSSSTIVSEYRLRSVSPAPVAGPSTRPFDGPDTIETTMQPQLLTPRSATPAEDGAVASAPSATVQ